MGDLMELINECETVSDLIDPRIGSAMAQAEELAALGFTAQATKIRERAQKKERMNRLATDKYVRVTETKIEGYLERLAKRYNDEQEAKGLLNKNWAREYDSAQLLSQTAQQFYAQSQQNIYPQLRGLTLGGINYVAPVVGEMFYTQLAVKTCHWRGDGKIGQFVWTERRIADYQGIPPKPVLAKLAEEKKKNLFDEFTIATVEGIHDPLLLGRINGESDRFFIAQWGDDVSLDDVI